MSRYTTSPVGDNNPPIWKKIWKSVVYIAGLDYWQKMPHPYRFDIAKHLKRTCQFTGAIVLGAFGIYSFSNWFQWRSYGIQMPWNFFGSYLHTVVLMGITAVSTWYIAYGVGVRAANEITHYKRYVENKYLPDSHTWGI